METVQCDELAGSENGFRSREERDDIVEPLKTETSSTDCDDASEEEAGPLSSERDRLSLLSPTEQDWRMVPRKAMFRNILVFLMSWPKL